MRILLLLLLLCSTLGVLVSGPCLSEDCGYGRRCYSNSQCECGFRCVVIRVKGGLDTKRCGYED